VPEPLFFFGAMSPYSWFAAERIDRLIPGARWQPVYAGAIFRATGRRSWGIDERRQAGIADCEARARAHGLGPIRWPHPWPTNDVLVARAMAHAEREGALRRFALQAMRTAFLEGGDLGDADVIAGVARRSGLDASTLTRAVQTGEIKDAVRGANDRALSFGVFGVPTVVVDGRLFWGDDQLRSAAQASGSS
jgi:2-hydroxychromene-2-carboxylate isomerase